jgi:dipeptidyl aminopeptidase/acylaminoacyl peptidase
MLSFRFAILVTAALCAQTARAANFEDTVAALYRPWQAEQVALAPDGEHVAFTRHERGELVIYLMAVSRTEPKFKITVEGDRPVAFSREKAPARLRFLRWASPTRVVFAPTRFNAGVRFLAPVYAVNVDGSDARTLAVDDDFAVMTESGVMISRATNILGFVPGDRTKLLVEAMGRSDIPTTLFSIDMKTAKIKTLTEEFESGRYFYDQDGHARIVYSHPRLAHTRTFRYQNGGTWARWTEVNEAWGGSLAKTFVVTVENYFGERAFPLGIDADPDVIYYASNVGRDTYGIYAFNARTKQRTDFAIEEPHVDLAPLEPGNAASTLVFDEMNGRLVGVRAVGVVPFTRWVDGELATLQVGLEKKFPQRTVEILQWDDARRRFLLRVTGGIEPGRYHVFQRPENVLVEVVRSAPWLRNTELNSGTTFEFDTAGGIHLTGYLTFPRQRRLDPPPLLIDFTDGVMDRAWPGFDREAQVLADMGFVVARVNHRGARGFGIKHRSALRSEGERAPVDDALAVIDWVARHHAIDRKRVATLGRGLGGYLALRALQLAPEAFRCAIAINAPLAPAVWLQPPLENFGPSPERSAVMTMGPPPPPPPPRPLNFVQEAQRTFLVGGPNRMSSVVDHAEQLTKPVMLVVDPPRDRLIAAQNGELRAKLKRLNRSAEYFEVGAGFAQNLPGDRAKMFRRIEEFFNLNLYDFNVKVGPTKEVK